MGDWVFGCDVCQQVCPWNLRFARPDGDPAFAPRPEVPAPDLRAELDRTAEGFNQKFKGSPVRRAKRRGYLRNVAVALGNSHSPASVPELASALRNDSEPLVRGHTAWALGRIGTRAAQQALASALESEPDPFVQEEILLALQEQAKTGEYDL
jgi:epoxyqueuosine reductase